VELFDHKSISTIVGGNRDRRWFWQAKHSGKLKHEHIPIQG
jgi:hypothetical protein